MKKYLMLGLSVLSLLTFSCKDREKTLNLLETEVDTKSLQFKFSRFDSALSKANEQDKYLFVYITSDGCGPCIKMERDVFSDNIVQAFFNDNFICSKVHIKRTASVMKTSEFKKLNETQIEFMDAHDIQLAFPTFLILDKAGVVLKKVTKYMDTKEFVQFGNEVVKMDRPKV